MHPSDLRKEVPSQLQYEILRPKLDASYNVVGGKPTFDVGSSEWSVVKVLRSFG